VKRVILGKIIEFSNAVPSGGGPKFFGKKILFSLGYSFHWKNWKAKRWGCKIVREYERKKGPDWIDALVWKISFFYRINLWIL